MKKTLPLILILLFSFSVFSQEEIEADTLKPAKTRNATLNEAFANDSVNKSILLKAFEGVGVMPVKEAYINNRLAVDSILEADSLSPTFFRLLAYQSVQLFVQANKSPSVAMSLMLPIFLIIFGIILVILLIRAFMIRPWIMNPEKPENDPNASRKRKSKKKEEEPEEEEEEEEDEEDESSQNQ